MTKGSREVDGGWLNQEFTRLGLSGAQVGKELGCDPKKIYNHINGETKLQAGLLAALWIAYPSIDMYYVLTGERKPQHPITDDVNIIYEAAGRIRSNLTGH